MHWKKQDIENMLYIAMAEDDAWIEKLDKAIECIPDTYEGMMALLSFCHDYDYEPAFDSLFERFEDMLRKEDYFEYYKMVTRAKRCFSDYESYEIILSRKNDNLKVSLDGTKYKVKTNIPTNSGLPSCYEYSLDFCVFSSKYIEEHGVMQITGVFGNAGTLDPGVKLIIEFVDKLGNRIHSDSDCRFRLEGEESVFGFVAYVPVSEQIIEGLEYVEVKAHVYR